ncbi:hypothetical protein FB45DRAFT_12758 [Roridomyces roridus]|uniref:Uncharacterized protein n=1 Tax=Roridomyces roridus TaxID=1738132 RepID=A0AAD7CIZ5_9AGAR|nr:hypothetical protein FB45DRAFT_12758 [Roridomyces roridus]
MRRAADPCLGFYLSPTPIPPAPPRPPSTPPVEVLQVSLEELPDLQEDDPEQQLTVDAFLRRSAVKTYRKKKSRRNDRDVVPLDADVDDEMSDAPRTRPRQSKRSLKKRIVKAAVQTHGDPDEFLLEEQVVSHSRTPLPFVEEPHLPIPKKRRTWSLVDPKKALATRSNAFPGRDKSAGGDEPKRDTLSGWHATYGIVYRDGSVISKRKGRGKGGKAAQESFKYPPLSFVALQEAERSYALMRMPHSAPFEPIIARSTRTPLDLLPPSSDMPPSDEAPHTPHPITAVRAEYPLLQSSHTPPSADQSATPTTHSVTVVGMEYTPLDIPLLADQPATPATHPDMASSAAQPPIHSMNLPVVPVVPVVPVSLTSPPVENHCDVLHVSQKPLLKPIGSFFNQFLQTARSETQLQNQKKAPRRVSPKSHPNRSKASFLRSAIRPAEEVHGRLTYAPDTSTFQFPVPSTPFFVPSSPNALQPTPYQVVLPSTPPTSRLPMSFAATESSLFSPNNRLLNPRV